MNDTPVLIVGAGPTGLALALFLQRGGVTPRIIDSQIGSGKSSRAMGVQARTLEFYRQLGFADEVVKAGISIDEIHMRVHGHVAAAVKIRDFGEGLSPYPFVLSFPQDEHEKLLIEKLRLTGVEVEWETDLMDLSDRGDSVRVSLRNRGTTRDECTAAYVCGYDGAHSTVRQCLQLGFPGGTYQKTFFVADVEATGDSAAPHTLNFCLNDNNFMLVLPVRTTGTNRLIGVFPDTIGDAETAKFDDLRSFVENTADIRVSKVNWFSTYRNHHRVADHFRVGRVFISGDAGHIHSPVGAQGMNTGIGDAVNLAWKLAAVITGRADPAVLDTYEPERIAFAHSLVATTDRMFHLMTGSGIGSQFFRETIFPYLSPFALGFPGMRTAAFRLISQTKIHYQTSALSEGAAGEIHAGDRLPWVPNIDGTDNFDPLKSIDWQVHVYGSAGHELRQAARATMLPLVEFPWTTHACEAGLQRDAIYLVRPDGYVAMADPEQDRDKLQAYLARFKITARDRVLWAK